MLTSLEKPPYRVPLMSEIVEIPWNGMNVVSTFAGAGGSSTGYRMAGYRVLLANEFVPIAQESYAANMGPHTQLAREDIKQLTGPEILKRIGLEQGELDVLDGSPPCQAFSTAGRREKGWGTDRHYEHGASQRNEDLFDEYVRLVHWLKPRVFVAENVSGLVKGTAKGYFLKILAALKGCGYRVEARLLDAQWLGVPQARQRIIFVGVREDLGLAPAFPDPLPYRYSVRDALPWLSRPIRNGNKISHSSNRGQQVSLDAPISTIMANGGSGQFDIIEPETDISGQAIGAEYDRLNPGQQSDKYFSLVRADADAPSPTITAAGGQNSGIACVVHPTEKRKFSIAEVKRLCGFPDDFILKGTYGNQWERLGNSVPPVMMSHVAAAIRDSVLLPARLADSHKAKRHGPARKHAASPAASAGQPNPAGHSPRPGRAKPTGGARRGGGTVSKKVRAGTMPAR